MPKRPSIDVGLTGGIASGKSAALAEFKKLGAETISLDAVTHELLNEPKIAPEAPIVGLSEFQPSSTLVSPPPMPQMKKNRRNSAEPH